MFGKKNVKKIYKKEENFTFKHNNMIPLYEQAAFLNNLQDDMYRFRHRITKEDIDKVFRCSRCLGVEDGVFNPSIKFLHYEYLVLDKLVSICYDPYTLEIKWINVYKR